MLQQRARKTGLGWICWTCVSMMLAGMAWPVWGSRPYGWPQARRCRACSGST
ncbi:MAG: hypothetical protein ACJ72N_04465 [Labedaea sp.]